MMEQLKDKLFDGPNAAERNDGGNLGLDEGAIEGRDDGTVEGEYVEITEEPNVAEPFS